MDQEQYIIVEEFCNNYEVEFSFISSLNEYGLIEILSIEEKEMIAESQLPKLEKLVRLHHDLHINIEGIDAIANLLERVKKVQEENGYLRNRLRFYESHQFR